MTPEEVQAYVYGFAIAGVIAGVIAMILFSTEKRLAGKAAVVAAVLLLCGSPLFQGLKKGPDLAGGSTLLYEVTIPQGSNTEEIMRQTIQVLQNRVDPNGVMNLTWRVEAGNRFEVLMPLAGDEVKDRRETFKSLQDSITKGNLRKRDVIDAMKLTDPERATHIEALAAGVPGRAELLNKAAKAYEKLDAARTVYKNLKPDTPEYIDAAGDVARAGQVFDDLVDQIIDTNLDASTITRVLTMSTKDKNDADRKPIADSSPRAEALKQLKTRHPNRADQVDQLVAAYDAYIKVKGPLDDPKDLERLIKGAGVLEFRIAVSNQEAADVANLRDQLRERGPLGQDRGASMKWYPIDSLEQWVDRPSELAKAQKDPISFLAGRRLIAATYDDKIYVLLWDREGYGIRKQDPRWQLTRAYPTQDQRGFPAVGFQLNEAGGSIMGSMTDHHKGRQMAIVLDGRVYSAPTIQSQIRDSGIITGGQGGFGKTELDYLIRTLNAGSLSANLVGPISVRNMNPSLGAENLRRGMQSTLFALIAVALFMMVYYFFAGFIADVALLANLVLILGLMSGLQATFTLPGIAGIVLTIGMCVDANVLVFERIREELNRGVDMKAALRLGYEKAMSSIMDGNLTNLIVCFVLGYTATADVKGFAVTLGIGICATLFASLFMTRVIFDIMYKYMGAGEMKMLPMTVKAVERALHPKFDWIGRRHVFFGISGALIALSLVLIFVRGGDILDIEFRAGTEVTFSLKDGDKLTRKEAEERIDKAGGFDTYNVVLVGDLDDKFRASEFSVVTTESDRDRVSEKLHAAFKDVLSIQPALTFDGSDLPELNPFDEGGRRQSKPAPVYPITKAKLDEVVPGLRDSGAEAPDYLGGVAIYLNHIDPPMSIDVLRDRIKSMRLRPPYSDEVPFRTFDVFPVERAANQPDAVSSAVVVVRDPDVSYFESTPQWEAALASIEWDLVRDALTQETSFSKVSSYDPSVAVTMTEHAIEALFFSIIAIVIYIRFRFGSLRHGLAAIIALVHDVIITLGLLAVSAYVYDIIGANFLLIEPFKINMPIIAALLTIVGYSLNDTIIIFDRIRENRGKLAVASPAIMNDSINQTISRTLITSGTTFLAIVVMYFDGGPGIHGFAFAMTVGIIVGTYSSIGVAAPLLLIGTKYGRLSASSPASDKAAPEPSR
ncbi:MAG: protein translocase subunit SecD [Phycisphaera sp.]|nr:protein translocase subunit SecD [Phycisphaera sp.]